MFGPGRPVAAAASTDQNASNAVVGNMRYPSISGFTVRPIALEDAPAWAAYICLAEVKRHTSMTAETVDDVRRDIEKSLVNQQTAPDRFVIESPQTRQLVGTVGFHTISQLHRTAEISYDVVPSHWGKGIATAACRAATLWGFEVRGWHRIQGTTILANLASQRVLERCGFQREGLLRNFRMVRGQPTDYWLYSAIPGV
jgi:ribosomal-protein-alanine N-acetyltransferase